MLTYLYFHLCYYECNCCYNLDIGCSISLYISVIFVWLLFFASINNSTVLPAESSSSSSSSSNCLTVYQEGGAEAVIRSPRCAASVPYSPRRSHGQSNCQIATLQGRRSFQEDRAVCAIGIKIPFLERTGVKETEVGIVAVFDGHNGAEASDMASKMLIDHFLLHIHYLLNEKYSISLRRPPEMLASNEKPNLNLQAHNLDSEQISNNFGSPRSEWISPAVFGQFFRLEVLKESLSRTIHDIDATFSKEALSKNLKSGSTANVVLAADGHILASNVGDSKSFLCSISPNLPDSRGRIAELRRRRRRNGIVSPIKLAECGSGYYVKELTKDHHPDRNEERERVEAAGGFVSDWTGVPRVNGQLAISRAIGDLSFKRYGVISTPEVTDWQLLTANDSYLVVATDGIFENLTTQDVCDLLWDKKQRERMNSDSTRAITSSLANCIVKAAFESGSMDNLSAVVIPLGFAGTTENLVDDVIDFERTSTSSYLGMKNVFDTMFGDLRLMPQVGHQSMNSNETEGLT